MLLAHPMVQRHQNGCHCILCGERSLGLREHWFPYLCSIPTVPLGLPRSAVIEWGQIQVDSVGLSGTGGGNSTLWCCPCPLGLNCPTTTTTLPLLSFVSSLPSSHPETPSCYSAGYILPWVPIGLLTSADVPASTSALSAVTMCLRIHLQQP